MRRESGDTLVEVLIATAILAAAVVGGLGMMNFGFGVILNSIERTQVQAGVNSQLSLIQYARDAYIRADRNGTVPGGAVAWQAILNNTTATYSNEVCAADPAGTSATATPGTDPSRKPFYIKDDGTQLIPFDSSDPSSAATDSGASAGKGLWVEAVRPTPTTNYIDFYVKACWLPSAGSLNQESRSTMRLYTGESVITAAVTAPAGSQPSLVASATCTNSGSNSNASTNVTFATSAGNGPGASTAARLESYLPNQAGKAYPPDEVEPNGQTATAALAQGRCI